MGTRITGIWWVDEKGERHDGPPPDDDDGPEQQVTKQRVPKVEGPTMLSLLPTFRIHLEAENKAERTIKGYAENVHRLHEFLVGEGMPTDIEHITSEHVETFMADQTTRLRPASARARYAGLRQFFKWAAEWKIIPSGESPMARMKPPKVEPPPVPVVPEDELKALLRAASKDTTFRGRRDEAVIRVFVETGARLAEVAGMTVEGVDLVDKTIVVLGKGGRIRILPIGPKTARAVSRYLLMRQRHQDAYLPELWLGRHGKLTVYGVDEAVRRRAEQAGIKGLHVHMLRHTAAHLDRVHGMDDASMVRKYGWKDPSMLHRYSASAADERMRETHRRIGWADRL